MEALLFQGLGRCFIENQGAFMLAPELLFVSSPLILLHQRAQLLTGSNILYQHGHFCKSAFGCFQRGGSFGAGGGDLGHTIFQIRVTINFMLRQEVQRPGSLFQIVEFCPLLIPCGLLGLDAVFQINPQRNFAVFLGPSLHEPPFDALGDSFLGVGFAQRFAAGEPPLSGLTERNILAPLDLIALLLQEQSYEVKRGKYVSFREPGQGRFTRCKTLGEAYTEEAITERIKGRFVERRPKENRKISLRIDLENSIKAQQSAGYEKWAKLHNLKQAARTLNFLTEHEIDSYPDLENRVAEITAASTEAAAALKAAERRLAEMAMLIKDVTTCKELRPLVQEYQRAADKKQFRRKHEGTLILYEAAAKALKEQGFQKLPDLYALKAEYKLLAEQKDQLQQQYAEAKRQMQEYGIIKQNVDGILRTAPGKEQMQER